MAYDKKAYMREYNREYRKRPYVRKRHRIYARKYYALHREQMRAYHKEYYQRPDRKERQMEYMRRYNRLPEVKTRKKYIKEEREFEQFLRIMGRMKLSPRTQKAMITDGQLLEKRMVELKEKAGITEG